MFFLMLGMVGLGASWAQEGVITTESDESTVFLEVQEGQKVNVICKTELGKKTWVFVNGPVFAPGATYVMAHDGLLYPLEKDSTDMYYLESPTTNFIGLGLND